MPSLVVESLTKTPPPLPLSHARATPTTHTPAGFWLRTLAHLIDSTIFSMIISPVLIALLMGDIVDLAAQSRTSPSLGDLLQILEVLHSPLGIVLQYVIPAVAVIFLWRWRSATPGKMILGLVIVDAETLGKPTTANLLIRFFGYLASMVPACLGFLWVAWDPRKQGWHDKLAGTLVVRTRF